jgi:EAL domain-containing protein (putative c-di-GMP-specific phosphodiesterase class I)
MARPRPNPLNIGVNVSAKQLGNCDLVDEVAELLQETRTDPRTLNLEITESAVGADTPSALQTLNGLHNLGVSLVMDDFGKGFSSLSYLRSLPVQVVKIDQSFVLGASGSNDQALLQAAVDMAHALHLRVVAEGVENVQQLKKVLTSGADLAQGYLFGAPRDALITV